MYLLFYSHDAHLYGASRSLVNLIEGLRMHGVDSHVVLPYPGDLEGELARRSVPYTVIPHFRWVSEHKPGKGTPLVLPYFRWFYDIASRLLRNMVVLRNHLEFIKGLNPDIVYTNTAVIPMGALASLLLKKKHVWHLREFKDIDHGMHLDFGNHSFKLLARFSDAVILNSHALQSYYAELTDPSRSHVVHNGIAFQDEFDERSQAAKKAAALKRPYAFGMVGYISESKGQHVAVRALALLKGRYPGIRLVVAGSGDHAGLKRLIAELRIEQNVDLLDFIKDPFEIYHSVDAYLMCSQNEAFGRVTAEAMSASLPVIGHDSAGTSEIIQHEQTGLLYKGGPEELARAMERFIQDPSWARRLGKKGWSIARERFSTERYADEVYKILQDVFHKGTEQRIYAHSRRESS